MTDKTAAALRRLLEGLKQSTTRSRCWWCQRPLICGLCACCDTGPAL